MTWRIPNSQIIKSEPPRSETFVPSPSPAKPDLGLKKLYEFSEFISRPLIPWRGFLLAVSETSSVYAFRAEDLKSPKPQPLRFLNLSEKIAVKGLPSPLLKEIRGVLAFPCGNKIYLWDIAANLSGRRISRVCPSCLKLRGELTADLATDGQNYLAALTCDAQGTYRLEIFEFTQSSAEPYYVFEAVGGAGGPVSPGRSGSETTFSLYCSRRAVYLLTCSRRSAYDLEKTGRLTCFSLASLTSKELPGRFYASYTADNVNTLLTGIAEDSAGESRCTLCRPPENPGPASGLQPEFIENTHPIRMYGRRDEGVWLIGSGISRLEGRNNIRTLVAPELIDQISMDSIPISVQGKLTVCLKSCQNGGRLYIFKDQFSFYPAESVSETFNFAASLASSGELCLGVSEDGVLCSLTLT